MKVGDLLIWDEDVEVEDSDWKDVGRICDWEDTLRKLNGVFKVTELSSTFPNHVMLQDRWYYPKKIFKQRCSVYELW